MSRRVYVKETGKEVIGTYEKLHGVALVSGVDENGEPEYDGETKVDWESQKTVRNKKGERLWVDEDWNTVPESELEFRDSEEEE